MLPEVVERRWYHFLFRHRNTLLKALLLLNGGPRIVLITAPWYVREPATSQAPSAPPERGPAIQPEDVPISAGG